jgi:hypothetical protein
MFKIIYTSSENHKNFGVFKVVTSINNELKKKKIRSIFSNNLLKVLCFKPDLIHINGCWKVRLIFFFILAKILKIKIIISPHGMMDPISLNQKSFKKKIALFLYQKIIFKNSDLIIVNSKIEKKNFLKIIKNVPKIIIIPHGINIDKDFKITKNKNKDLKFIFFSRIHKSKNLDILVKLWKNDNFFEKLKLDIYGEILNRKYFTSLNIKYSKNINYIGPLNNNIQQNLSKYDVLIHPSKSENFGLVIFEALSSGLFLILNKKLEKKFLEKNNFAKNIEFNSKELRNTIKNIIKNKRKIKSNLYKKKSLNYVKKNFDWEKISNLYIQNYKKLFDPWKSLKSKSS